MARSHPLQPLLWARPALISDSVPQPTKKLVRSSIQVGTYGVGVSADSDPIPCRPMPEPT
jgi:hypothetical protein